MQNVNDKLLQSRSTRRGEIGARGSVYVLSLSLLVTCLSACSGSRAALPPSEAAASSPPKINNRYALVIGIKGYPKYPAAQQLAYSDSDAQLFADFIVTPEAGAFPRQNIKLLLNQDATRDGIMSAIQWLRRVVRREDLVYVFFAGHGSVDLDTDKVFFMPYNADPSLPSSQGIRADNFFQEIRDSVAPKNLIFFIDACYAGAALNAGGTTRAAGTLSSELTKAWERVFTKSPEGVMSLHSAGSQQPSWEDSKLGHGLFTWYLVRGLKGDASRDMMSVTLWDVYRYVLDHVTAHAESQFGAHQMPVISAGADPAFPLSILGTSRPPAEEPAHVLEQGPAPRQQRQDMAPSRKPRAEITASSFKPGTMKLYKLMTHEGFSVHFPVKPPEPRRTKSIMLGREAPSTIWMAEVDDDTVYLVGYLDLPAELVAANAAMDIVNCMQECLTDGHPGSFEMISLQGTPGGRYYREAQARRVEYRVLLVGSRLYVLAARHHMKDLAVASEFLESFALAEPPPGLAPASARRADPGVASRCNLSMN